MKVSSITLSSKSIKKSIFIAIFSSIAMLFGESIVLYHGYKSMDIELEGWAF